MLLYFYYYIIKMCSLKKLWKIHMKYKSFCGPRRINIFFSSLFPLSLSEWRVNITGYRLECCQGRFSSGQSHCILKSETLDEAFFLPHISKQEIISVTVSRPFMRPILLPSEFTSATRTQTVLRTKMNGGLGG